MKLPRRNGVNIILNFLFVVQFEEFIDGLEHRWDVLLYGVRLLDVLTQVKIEEALTLACFT